jgi:hypothetical protein
MNIFKGWIKRRGVGAILGGAFFLLIFTSVVSFLYMYMIQTHSINDVYAISIEMDKDKVRETLDVYSIEVTPTGYLNITIENTGHITSQITYIGEIDQLNPLVDHLYYPSDIAINPGEIATNIAQNNITYQDGDLKNIQIITKLGNIFSYTYPRTADQASGSSIIYIFEVGPPFYPDGYKLLGGTQNVTGGIEDLNASDNSYMGFSSYIAFSEENFYPDNNNSNVDGNSSIGIHSSFTNMQSGPDSSFDTLTENETTNIGAITYIKPSSFNDINNKWDNEQNAWDIDNNTSATSSRDRVIDNIYWQSFNNTDKGTIFQVDLHARLDVNFITIQGGGDSITVQWWVGSTQGSGTYTIDSSNDGSDLLVSFNDVAEPNDGEWTWNDINNLEIRQVGSPNGPPDSVDMATDEVWGEVSTYAQELDLEVQFTDVNYDLDNEELCIYAGSIADEDLQVDVWHNSSWNNLFPSLSSGWNNASVSSYLESPTFTIRFKETEVAGDSVQSSWNIDVALLNLWDLGKETVKVEFTGLCNASDFSRLYWSPEINCNVSSVPIKIQLYDFEAQNYSMYGEGYLSYTSSTIPGTDEKINQTINTNPTRFVNSSGYWKLRVTGAKTTNNTIQLNLDLTEFEPFYMLPGNTVQFDEWVEYGVKVTTSSGDPIKYGYFSLYHNATSLNLRDSDTEESISNPDLLLLDSNGEYYFDLKSSNGDEEEFHIGCTLGDTNTEKIITQVAP